MSDDKNFTFLEEEVVDCHLRKHRILRIAKKALFSGIIFGVTTTGIWYSFYMAVRPSAPKASSTPIRLENATEEKEQASVKPERKLKGENLQSFHNKFGKLAQKCQKYLVGIESNSNNQENIFFFEQESCTAGVLVAETDFAFFVLTSYSSVKNNKQVQVYFCNEQNAMATVYSKDSHKNLAILKIQKKNLDVITQKIIQPVKMGQTDLLNIGDLVFSFGSPNGSLFSAEYGYVTSVNTEHAVTDYQMDLYTTNMLYHAEGNGMICNADGEMLGWIVTEGNNLENCTFYGMRKLKPIIENMLNCSGYAYTGILAKDVPESLLQQTRIRSGIYVEAVAENSPAYNAGILVGDIIYRVDGEKITSIVSYYNQLQTYEEDTKVTVYLLRNAFSKPQMKKVKLKVKAVQGK